MLNNSNAYVQKLLKDESILAGVLDFFPQSVL